MKINKNELKQNDLLIDMLIDNLLVDNYTVTIDNILDIKKEISNIQTMNKIYEDSKKIDDSFYSRKIEILIYLLKKAKELNYDLSLYDFPISKNIYYTLNLYNAEKIIEDELLTKNTIEDKIVIVKDYYNEILDELILAYTNIIVRKIDKILPPSKFGQKTNAIIDEMHDNNILKNVNQSVGENELGVSASDLQAQTEKDTKLFNQLLDEIHNEYERVIKDTEIPKGDYSKPETKFKMYDENIDNIIADIDKKLEELEKKKKQ